MNAPPRPADDHWTRFEAWEIQRLRERPADFRAALEWLSDAWELAERMDPAWGSRANAERDWRHHAQVQRDLRRAFGAARREPDAPEAADG